MSFDAFISYSHAADGRLAPALQRAIQRLAKPWYRARALRVFRDDSALSANPHLWSSIQTALDDAEWFVLLASPDATASEWVNRELTHWLSTKSADRILVVLTDGTLEWDSQALSGTAVPPALRDAFADEPRHVDLRWAAIETDLDMHHARFRDVVAQLAAPMHGMAKDDLDSEDVRQHRRAQRLARGGVTVLTLLVVISLVATTFAFLQRRDAVTQRDEARTQRNRATKQTVVATAEQFAASATAKSTSAADQALLLGVEGYQRENSATTRAALLGTLTAAPQLIGFLPGPHDATTSAISPDGTLVVAGTSNGSLRFWKVDSSDPSALVGGSAELKNDRIVAITFDHSGKRLFVLHDSGTVEFWDPSSRRVDGDPVQIGQAGALSIVASPDGRTIAVAGLGNGVGDLGQRTALYDAVARKSLGSLAGALDVAFSSDGRTAYSWGHQGTAVTGFDVATLSEGNGVFISPSIASALAAGTDAQGRRLAAIAQGPSGCGFVCGASLSDATSGRLLANFAQNLSVNAIAMSSDASTIVIGGIDGTLEVWTWNGARVTFEDSFAVLGDKVSLLEPPLSQHSGIAKITLAADGNRMVTTANDGTTRAWDLSGAGALASGPSTSNLDKGFTLSPDGSGLASTGEEVRRWGIRNARGSTRNFSSQLTRPSPVDTAPTPDGLIPYFRAFVAFDPTGKHVVEKDTIYAPGAKPRVSSRIRGKLIVGGSNLSPYAFAVPYGQLDTETLGGLGFRGVLSAIDIWTGRAVGSIRPASVKAQLLRAHPSVEPRFFLPVAINQTLAPVPVRAGQLAIDRRGRRAATISSAGDVVVWDLRTGGSLGRPLIGDEAAHTQATAVEFSPDGTQLAVGRLDGSVTRYSLPGLQPVGSVFRSHAAGIGQIAYQPGGSLLAVASAEGVDLYDLASGVVTPLLAFTPPGGQLGVIGGAGFVQFDRSGGLLLTKGYVPDRAALLWSLVPSDWAAAACRAAGRNLTTEEWKQLVGDDLPYHRTCSQWPAGT